MINKVVFFIVISFCLLATTVSAQSLFSNVQKKYNAITDFSVDFKQAVNGTPMLSGKYYTKTGNKVKLETPNLDIISDGKTNWTVNKKENKVAITGYDKSDLSILSIKTLLSDYAPKCSVKQEGNNVLTLEPNKGANLGFKKATLTIGADNFVNSVTIKDNNGTQYKIDLFNYGVNLGQNDSRFSFNPPQGMKVIDLR